MNKPRNFVQKHMNTFNKAQIHKNKKWESTNSRKLKNIKPYDCKGDY